MPLTVTIVSPERPLPPVQADHVTLPASDGEMGIRIGHAPLATLLGEGPLLIKNQDKADHIFAVKGGVAMVLKDEVTVLADTIVNTTAISEAELVRRLKALNDATYDDPTELVKARAEAHWYATQLQAAGKQIPDVSKLGI
jgi:F-type H+-transporting ATPase subunit epsilon